MSQLEIGFEQKKTDVPAQNLQAIENRGELYQEDPFSKNAPIRRHLCYTLYAIQTAAGPETTHAGIGRVKNELSTQQMKWQKDLRKEGAGGNMKTGLIMEGGAMRGMYTAGVLDVMMENDLRFDGAIGVSAGAAFGCNYKSGQIGRVIRYNKKYCRDRRFCSFWSLLTTGDLYGADFCYRLLPEELDPFDSEAYEKNPMEFHVVCTDMDTGEAVYHRCDHGEAQDILWMRASASIPVVSRPVEIGSRRLLDGGIADSVPVRYFESIGYERNVIILTRPQEYVKKRLKLIPLLRILYPGNRQMVDAIARRHEMYNETIRYIQRLEKEGRAYVVRPLKDLEIGSVEHDPEELERVYQEGRKAAQVHLQGMKSFLKEAKGNASEMMQVDGITMTAGTGR